MLFLSLVVLFFRQNELRSWVFFIFTACFQTHPVKIFMYFRIFNYWIVIFGICRRLLILVIGLNFGLRLRIQIFGVRGL